jgi:archaellum component FlaC
MGLGSTAKKIQKVADVADEVYTKVNELKTQLQDLRQTVEATNDRVDEFDHELAEQRALVEALAEQQGLDPESVIEAADTGTEETDDAEAPAQSD